MNRMGSLSVSICCKWSVANRRSARRRTVFCRADSHREIISEVIAATPHHSDTTIEYFQAISGSAFAAVRRAAAGDASER
jgi:hypothetical protein